MLKNPCCCYTGSACLELIIAIVPDTFKTVAQNSTHQFKEAPVTKFGIYKSRVEGNMNGYLLSSWSSQKIRFLGQFHMLGAMLPAREAVNASDYLICISAAVRDGLGPVLGGDPTVPAGALRFVQFGKNVHRMRFTRTVCCKRVSP